MRKIEMKERYPCPNCKKRVFDARDEDKAVITLKCPHCRQIIDVIVSTQGKPLGIERTS